MKDRFEKGFLTDKENGGWIKQIIAQGLLWDITKISEKPVIESNEYGQPEYEVEYELHYENGKTVSEQELWEQLESADNPPKVAFKKEKKGKGYEQLSLL